LSTVEEVIPFVRVTDAHASADWYRRLGFQREWAHQFGPEFPVTVAVSRGGPGSWIFLSEHEGDATPDALVYVRVADVDAIAAELGADVADRGWAREIEVVDPDGNRVRIGTPTPATTPAQEFTP
jgi:catechol 2,3-dioxygenase-like lactoylglutathione lyase family enzyme